MAKIILILISLVAVYRVANCNFITCEKAVEKFTGTVCIENSFIAKGASAEAYLVSKNDQKRVLKIQKMEKPMSLRRALDEVQILRTINNPNIVKLYEIHEDGKFFYMMLEYAEKGNLKMFIRLNAPKFEVHDYVFTMFYQILDAVESVQQLGIMHADIKSDNIILSKDERPILIDFDLAVPIGEEDTPRGTPEYMAPELVLTKEKVLTYSESSEIYSLGVLLFEMIHGKYPFPYTGTVFFLNQIRSGKYKVKAKVRYDFVNIFHSCMQFDPQLRPNISQLKEMVKNARENPKDRVLPTEVVLNTQKTLGEQLDEDLLPKVGEEISSINKI